MENLIKWLQDAAGSGEIITVAYGGGSRPGQPRKVIILSCSDADLRVREVDGHIVKRYKLAKVLWAENSSGQHVTSESNITWFNAAKSPYHPLPIFETLQQYADYLRLELEQAGWHVHQGKELLGVGTCSKKGAPRKNPSIMVTYSDRSMEIMWSLEKNDLAAIPREVTAYDRPWRIDSWLLSQGKTFGRLDRAMEFFMAQVRASDPKKAKIWSAHPRIVTMPDSR